MLNITVQSVPEKKKKVNINYTIFNISVEWIEINKGSILEIRVLRLKYLDKISHWNNETIQFSRREKRLTSLALTGLKILTPLGTNDFPRRNLLKSLLILSYGRDTELN